MSTKEHVEKKAETSSGIEMKTVFGPPDARCSTDDARAERSRVKRPHAALRDDVSRQAVDDAPVRRLRVTC